MKLNKTPFVIFFAAAMFYILPIIAADRYFIDDYNRAFLGYLSWSDNGRPLADVVMTLLNFNAIISDVSPLTQILGVASLFPILFFLMQTNVLSNVKLVACALCVLVTPFMLETLSYAYDSLPMLSSISLVFLPFCIKIKNKFIELLLHFLAIVFSLSLYQASIGIYVIVSLFSYTLKENKDKNGLIGLVFNALSFILGYAFYSKVIAKQFISGGYSLNRAEFIDFTAIGGTEAFIKNIVKYFNFLMLGYPTPFLIISLLISISGIVGIAIRSKEFINHESVFSKIAFAITLLSPLLSFSMIIAPLSVLANPPMMSRVLCSTGVVMMLFMSYSFRLNFIFSKMLTSTFAALFMLYSFSTVYAYGNAQEKQKEFESDIISMMRNDVLLGDAESFDIYGTAPTSPVSSLIVSQHPIMEWLVLSNITFRDEWRTNITLSNFRFPLKYKAGAFPGDVSNPGCNFMIKPYNGIYTLFEKSGVIMFYFRRTCTE